MTEPILFRKVFCKDRLPDRDGVYDTGNKKSPFIGDNPKNVEHWKQDIRYWYEPVQEPTEDEINNKYQTFQLGKASSYQSFKGGYNQALQDLKEKQ